MRPTNRVRLAATLGVAAMAVTGLQLPASAALPRATTSSTAVGAATTAVRLFSASSWNASHGGGAGFEADLTHVIGDAVHTVEVDWGDGLVDDLVLDGTPVEGPPLWFEEGSPELNHLRANHSYGEPGSYEGTVTMTTDSGASAQAGFTMTVPVDRLEQPPVLSFDPDTRFSVQAGEDVGMVAYAGVQRYDDVDNAAIFWGDGTSTGQADVEMWTMPTEEGDHRWEIVGHHRYAEPGTYRGEIVLVASDQTTHKLAFTYTVLGADTPAPTISLPVTNLYRWQTGATSEISALVDYTDARDILTATLDWGDGTRKTGRFDAADPGGATGSVDFYQAVGSKDSTQVWLHATHRYAGKGSYEATLTVTNAAGRASTVELTEHVLDREVQHLALDPVVDQVYGTTLRARVTPGESGRPVWMEASPADVCRVRAGTFLVDMVGVGECTLLAHQGGDDAYEPADSLVRFTVHPAALTVTTDDITIASGSTPAYTARYDGLVRGDTAAVVHGLRATGPAGTPAPGRYSINHEGGSAANYTIAYVGGTLTVDPVLTIHVTGLPEGIGRVTVDGESLVLPVDRLQLAYGRSHRYAVAPTMTDTDGTIYVTTTHGYFGTVTRDLAVTAAYHTIPGLVADASDDPRTTRRLTRYWLEIQDDLADGTSRRTLADLHWFADRVQAEEGDTMTADDVVRVLDHLQVVYRSAGGSGWV